MGKDEMQSLFRQKFHFRLVFMFTGFTSGKRQYKHLPVGMQAPNHDCFAHQAISKKIAKLIITSSLQFQDQRNTILHTLLPKVLYYSLNLRFGSRKWANIRSVASIFGTNAPIDRKVPIDIDADTSSLSWKWRTAIFGPEPVLLERVLVPIRVQNR